VKPPANNKTCDILFCKSSFDDSTWRDLNLPHDFVVEGTFTPNGDRGHGYLPKGVGWYRKHFAVPETEKGKSIWIFFDGSYRATQVWLNDVLLGYHASGYTSFRFPIDDVAHYGQQENVLAVRTDCTHNEGFEFFKKHKDTLFPLF